MKSSSFAAARVGAADGRDEVGRDELRRRGVATKDGRLPVEKLRRLVGREASEVEHRVRAHAVEERRVRRTDLTEVVVLQAPEGRAPLAVQHLHGLILRAQPVAEGALRRRAVVGRRVRLVVELPSPDRRVLAVTLAEFVHDALGQAQVVRVGERVVTARAVLAPTAVLADEEGVRVLLREPRGRRWRRRAEDDLQVMLRGERDRAVEPREVEPALLRLHERPRELAHVDELEPEPLHVGEVPVPLRLRPVLRVVVCADPHQVFAGEVARRGRLRQRRARAKQRMTRRPQNERRSFFIGEHLNARGSA